MVPQFCSNQLSDSALGVGTLVWPQSAGIHCFPDFVLLSTPWSKLISISAPSTSSPLASLWAEQMPLSFFFFYHCSHSDTPSAFPLQKIHESLYLNLSLKPLEEACSVFIVLINSLYCHMLWHPHWGHGTGARPLGQRVTPELQTQAPPHCIYVT